MENIKEGFYFIKAEMDKSILVLAEYNKEGALKIQDYFGGLYGRSSLDKKEPLTPEKVEALIEIDRMKIKFVEEGLARLAQSTTTAL